LIPSTRLRGRTRRPGPFRSAELRFADGQGDCVLVVQPRQLREATAEVVQVGQRLRGDAGDDRALCLDAGPGSLAPVDLEAELVVLAPGVAVRAPRLLDNGEQFGCGVSLERRPAGG